MAASLILDGYTLDGRLEARGPWPALTFRYRPALAENVYEYLRERDQNTGKARLKIDVNFLGNHLVAWDINDAEGSILPVSPELLRKLPSLILTGLLDHVLGYAGEAEVADAKN